MPSPLPHTHTNIPVTSLSHTHLHVENAFSKALDDLRDSEDSGLASIHRRIKGGTVGQFSSIVHFDFGPGRGCSPSPLNDSLNEKSAGHLFDALLHLRADHQCRIELLHLAGFLCCLLAFGTGARVPPARKDLGESLPMFCVDHVAIYSAGKLRFYALDERRNLCACTRHTHTRFSHTLIGHTLTTHLFKQPAGALCNTLYAIQLYAQLHAIQLQHMPSYLQYSCSTIRYMQYTYTPFFYFGLSIQDTANMGVHSGGEMYPDRAGRDPGGAQPLFGRGSDCLYADPVAHQIKLRFP